MRNTIILISVALLWCSLALTAQAQDNRLESLAARILERIPDIPSTRRVLGRRGERPQRALEQAKAILSAADANATRWDEFAIQGGWGNSWNTRTDLPALIAAMAMRESYMRPIIRLDGGGHVYELPTAPVNVRRMHERIRAQRRLPTRIVRADMGVMQVRAPSAPARACGVRSRADHRRLATDLAFGYLVGTCVMTNRVSGYITRYTTREYRRLRRNQRPDRQLRFYGVWGPRRNTPEASRARNLLVLERYNWGGGDFYLGRISAGYAQRVIREFEFFRAAPLRG